MDHSIAVSLTENYNKYIDFQSYRSNEIYLLPVTVALIHTVKNFV